MLRCAHSSKDSLKVTTICALPAAIVGCAGGFGTAPGTAAAEAGEAGLVPTPLVAVTVHV